NPVLLHARVSASLEKKRLRDQEQAYLRRLEAERERSERLLLNILPAPVIERLKQQPETIADSFSDVTVLFADIVNFTKLAASIPPAELVDLLNRIFSTFDRLADQHGLEKIKTIGDAYMAVGGLPTPRADHAEAVAEMALDMQDAISRFEAVNGNPFKLRMGINSGPVVAGVLGTKKFIYDLWGDTVNIASRMESQGIDGHIQVTQVVYERLRDRYEFEERGPIDIRGKGKMPTYLLRGRKKKPTS
ncbi:MAG TPA: adenylate/guanylate cyclase domain-containing protein, partial [Chloroflexi bacterium]|nr:adenylate/guanylate cyclase domain-containing protein [Chloroflexota bacterium]